MKPIAVLFAVLLFAAVPARADEAGDIAALLQDQAAAWNAGDIDTFMETYWKSDKLRFASGGDVTYGWQETLDGYKARYDTPEKMGKLTFSGLDIKVLSDQYALAFGHWKLDRKEGPLEGIFTLLLENRPEGWRIIADHTSEALLPFMVIAE